LASPAPTPPIWAPASTPFPSASIPIPPPPADALPSETQAPAYEPAPSPGSELIGAASSGTTPFISTPGADALIGTRSAGITGAPESELIGTRSAGIAPPESDLIGTRSAGITTPPESDLIGTRSAGITPPPESDLIGTRSAGITTPPESDLIGVSPGVAAAAAAATSAYERRIAGERRAAAEAAFTASSSSTGALTRAGAVPRGQDRRSGWPDFDAHGNPRRARRPAPFWLWFVGFFGVMIVVAGAAITFGASPFARHVPAVSIGPSGTPVASSIGSGPSQSTPGLTAHPSSTSVVVATRPVLTVQETPPTLPTGKNATFHVQFTPGSQCTLTRIFLPGATPGPTPTPKTPVSSVSFTVGTDGLTPPIAWGQTAWPGTYSITATCSGSVQPSEALIFTWT
jgi:hypothetical protein